MADAPPSLVHPAQALAAQWASYLQHDRRRSPHTVRAYVATAHRLIDFLGLPWDDRCLRYWESDRTVMTLSYDHVNKPIYDSSIGRWKNYEKHLGPLKKALGLSA